MSEAPDSTPRQTLDGVRPDTLAELAALSDEIAALVRAGVPLEAGLQSTARDLPPRLARLVGALSERLARGQALADAIAAQRPDYPPVLLAVVEAGVRSGRVAEAVEGIADVSHRLVELRGSMIRAMVYPLAVLLLAYALFQLYVATFGQTLVAGLEEFDVPAAEPLRQMIAQAALGQRYWYVPLLVLGGLLAAGWYVTGRPSSLAGGWLRGLLGWLPGLRRMFRSWDAARLTSLLALLVEQRIPWPDALRMASATSVNPRIRSAGEAAASAAEAGSRSDPTSTRALGLPPLLGWALAVGADQGQLPLVLRETADAYRRQALADAELARTLWPMVVLFALGGTATLAYGLLLFYPLTRLFETLSRLGT